ncbi:hypothetical protein QBZ16_001548 [Prototheca wickerhamii]|uniref:Ribonuclease H2 subunit B wHTH domain-containing protein n=1 Tax=Prototheca wickerhamii TaxID=3111 RepID=A0AAD9IGN1_PROWI|nr:hypothetical protein QBZ16_001548 [Prototheca wickerhamii]
MGDALCEITIHRPNYGSWFLGQSVVQDGATCVATPVDPLFILLPALEKAAGRGYCDSEAIVEGLGPLALAVPALRRAKFDAVCETKTAGDLSFYLLNKTKAMLWLEGKVAATKEGLKQQRAWANAGPDGDDSLTAYAVGLLGEYLSESWLAALRERLGVEPPPVNVGGLDYAAMEYGVAGTEPEAKKPKAQANPKELAKLKAAEARQATKAAKLAKEAAGMRKLSGFFTVKPSQ